MSRILEDGLREFPFPRIDSPRTGSSSASSSLPSRSDGSESKSLRSSSSSVSQPSLHRSHFERESHDIPPSKLLSRLMTREGTDSRSSLRTVLAITTERLESETRRADDAERRVLEVLRKLRAAHEATMLAQAEASRAKEELTLYKYRLDDAQREILRAQELLNELEQQRLEAEAEAARARSTARRYREHQLVQLAREEGRQEGYEQGLSRGKDLGLREARLPHDSRDRKYGVTTVEDVTEEEEEEEEEQQPQVPQFRSQTSGPAEIRVRTPAPEYRAQTAGPSMARPGRVTPPTPPQVRRPPSRFSPSRASQRPHVPDVAHFAPTLPVPTVATPLNMPSPSHSRADTPIGLPVPHPAPRSLDDGEVPAPIPIYEPAPSPVHPPIEVPPDGYIPHANSTDEIFLPPPHELSRPVTPVEPTMTSTTIQPSQHSVSMAPTGPEVRSRDYASSEDILPEGVPLTHSSSTGRPFSPLSKASTTISQFDLVGAPKSKLRVATAGRSTREDRQAMSPRGPRPREDLPAPSPTSPLERLFKKKFRSKSYKGKETPPVIPPNVIPDIVIESPSTPSTSRSSMKTTITHPHLLSPEQHSTQPLPSSSDEITVMRAEVQNYYPLVPMDQFMPPVTSSALGTPVIPLSSDHFPPGFVPLTPPTQSGSLPDRPVPIPSNTPILVPSNTPVPVPPPGYPTPIPAPSNTPVPIPPRNPIPVPSKEALPIPHQYPLPIRQEEPLPVPSPRGGRYMHYNEAPIPSGVVYPEPPSRRQTPVGSVRSGSSTSTRKRYRRDVRSPGERLSPLPLHFFTHLRSETASET